MQLKELYEQRYFRIWVPTHLKNCKILCSYFFMLRSPLCHAVYKANQTLVDFLVSHCKADIHAEFLYMPGTHASLLHVAAERENKTILKSLHTDYGLDINTLDSLYQNFNIEIYTFVLVLRGNPPLSYCRLREVYDFMVALGALEDIVNDKDSYPIDNLVSHHFLFILDSKVR